MLPKIKKSGISGSRKIPSGSRPAPTSNHYPLITAHYKNFRVYKKTQTCSGKVQPFWLVINSWGKDWGMNGVFMIAQGINECKIEAWGAAFGKPKV